MVLPECLVLQYLVLQSLVGLRSGLTVGLLAVVRSRYMLVVLGMWVPCSLLDFMALAISGPLCSYNTFVIILIIGILVV